MSERTAKPFEKGRPPRVRLLADNPVRNEKARLENFGLHTRLGFLYDTIRHPNIDTPLTVMVSGGWGSGKTSAMQSLKNSLDDWTKESNELTTYGKVYTVNFFPWKYSDKNDVWRGLIAEVMLARLESEADPQRVIDYALQYSSYLGRGFLDATIAYLNQKIGVDLSTLTSALPVIEKPEDKPAEGKIKRSFKFLFDVGKSLPKISLDVAGKTVEIDPLKLEKLQQLADKHFKPQDAYLNQFELALQNEVKDWLGDKKDKVNDRLVVFIDDLDRCMPDIALQVLECLKLYLNIPNLIFIVGVDRHVIQLCVNKKYADVLGADAASKEEVKKKIDRYLDKMFQVEVDITPSVENVHFFFDDLLKKILVGNDQDLFHSLGAHREKLRDIVISYAESNPRSVVRTLNLAIQRADTTADLISALQFELISLNPCIERLGLKSVLRSSTALEFLRDWSEVVVGQQQTFLRQRLMSSFSTEDKVDFEKYSVENEPSVSHIEAELVSLGNKHPKFSKLLGEFSIGNLLALHRFDAAAIQGMSTLPLSVGMDDLREEEKRFLFDLYVKQTGDQSQSIEDRPWEQLTELDVSYSNYDDRLCAMISKLSGLTSLNVSNNNIGDEGSEHLSNLSGLSRLNVSENNIGDTGAKHLSKLSGLTSLDVSYNNLGEKGAEHLSKLSSLNSLDVSHNMIGEKGAEHLSKLSGLTSLDVSHNMIGEKGAEHLSKLSGLTSLDVSYNNLGATGVEHLSKLSGLTSLSVRGNIIGDTGAEHLSKLSGLTELNVSGNSIGEQGVEHLSNLSGLTELNVSDNNIGDTGAEHLSELSGLTGLNVSGNNIGKKGAEHLSNLSGLKSLDIRVNNIGNIGAEHLSNLSGLTGLNVGYNNLGDTGAEHLSKLYGLTLLDVSYNNLGDTGAEHLSKLYGLTLLIIGKHNIGEKGKAFLKQALPKCTILA